MQNYDVYGTTGSNFGYDVGIEKDGNYIIVGAPEMSSDSYGFIRVYYNDNNGNMTQITEQTGTALGDKFGFSVDIQKFGTDIFFIACAKLTTGGYIKIFKYDGSTTTQVGSTISENNVSKVKFSKNNVRNICVGKPVDSTVCVYNYDSSSNTWIKVGSDIS